MTTPQGQLRPDADGEGSSAVASVLQLAGHLVPQARRADWTREWQAELWHLRHSSEAAKPRTESDSATFATTLSLARGLLTDAAWLRWDWLKAAARGSAGACLCLLLGWCVFCAVAEWWVAGSWQVFATELVPRFQSFYSIVVVPAIVIAFATYPPRQMKWETQSVELEPSGKAERCSKENAARTRRWFSARVRWSGFLWAKLALTLILGFLAIGLVRTPIASLIGRYVDWFDLLGSGLFVTLGLRWVLLDQEHRCQKCLRVLGQPTRVGPPSRNFLDWSGTELACTNGHGLLHIAEMPGSWCWYDRWVELDPVLSGYFPAL
jgi:hypothetical protein